MRGTAITGTTLIAAAVIGVSALVAGCGSQPVPSSGRPATAPPSAGAGADGSPASSSCVTPKLTGSAKTFTITEQDNGKSFCVTAGTGIFVFLHGTRAAMWARIVSSSPVVEQRPSGMMTLMVGVTGGYFVAARLGTATLTSVRGACPGSASAGAASPGTASPGTATAPCGTQSVFRVSVLVRGTM